MLPIIRAGRSGRRPPVIRALSVNIRKEVV